MIVIKNINTVDKPSPHIKIDLGKGHGEKSSNPEFLSMFNSNADNSQLNDKPFNMADEIEQKIDKDNLLSSVIIDTHQHRDKNNDNKFQKHQVLHKENGRKLSLNEGFRNRDLSENGFKIHREGIQRKLKEMGVFSDRKNDPLDQIQIKSENTTKGLKNSNYESSELKHNDLNYEPSKENREKSNSATEDKTQNKLIKNTITQHEPIINDPNQKPSHFVGEYRAASSSSLSSLSDTIKSEIREFQTSTLGNGTITIKIKPSVLGEIVITLNRDDVQASSRNNHNVDVRITSSNPEVANYLSLIKRDVLNKYGVRSISILNQLNTNKAITKISSLRSLIDEEKEECKI